MYMQYSDNNVLWYMVLGFFYRYYNIYEIYETSSISVSAISQNDTIRVYENSYEMMKFLPFVVLTYNSGDTAHKITEHYRQN